MAHVEHEDQIRDDLVAHRDRIQKLLDRLSDDISCATLLSEVQRCHRALGDLCAELAIEHVKRHIADEADAHKRDTAANEVATLLRDAFN
jgi:hypothetical protein